MPRAVDPRNFDAEGDPTRSGTDFDIQQYMLNEIQAFTKGLELLVEQAHQAIIDFIRGLTGIDLGGVEEFFSSLFDGLLNSFGLDLPGIGQAFQGIDLNPGAILAAIASAIQGIVTGIIQKIIDSIFGGITGGTSIGNPVDGLQTLIQQLQQGITNALNSAASAYDIVTQFGALLHSIVDGLTTNPIYVDAQDFIAQIEGVVATLVGTGVQAAEDAAGWIIGFFNAVTGQNQTNVTVAQAAQQAAAMAEQQLETAILVAQQQAAVDGAANSGLYSDDSFERLATTDINGAGGAGFWAKTSSQTDAVGGYYAIADSHTASFISGSSTGSVDQHIVFRRTKTDDQYTKTLYQKVGLVIGAFTGNGPFFFGFPCDVRLRCRLSNDEKQEVFVNVTADGKAQWGYRNGSLTDHLVGTLDAIDGGPLAAGNIFYLVAGTTGGLRQFQLYRNTRLVSAWNDTGSLSAAVMGTNNGWGFGGDSIASAQGPNHPPDVAIVSIADNTPVPVVGSTFRTYRLSSTGVAWGSSVWNPAIYDTVDYITADMTYNATTGELTVTQSGTYRVDVRGQLSAVFESISVPFALALAVNGTTKKWLDGSAVDQGSSSYFLGSLSGHGSIYLSAGQKLTVVWGQNDGRSANVVGDAAGVRTYLEVVKVG